MDHAGTLLRELRKARGISLSELARKTGVDKSHLSRAERGLIGLTFSTIQLISHALSLSREEAQRLINLANPRGRFSDMAADSSEMRHPDWRRNEVVIEGRAQQTLHEYGIANEPILHPPIPYLSIVKHMGLSVREVLALPKDVDAELDFDKREILLDAGTPAVRNAFSCCHEIGHWVLHKSKLKHACRVNDVLAIPVGDLELREAVIYEIQANAFASALLMPSFMVFSAAEQFRALNRSSVLDLARRFGTSFDAMRYRLIGLGLLGSSASLD